MRGRDSSSSWRAGRLGGEGRFSCLQWSRIQRRRREATTRRPSREASWSILLWGSISGQDENPVDD